MKSESHVGGPTPTRPGWVARRQHAILLALLALAGGSLIVRAAIIAISTGSNDMLYWGRFAYLIQANGLLHTYRTVEIFNHPPLPSLAAAWAMGLSMRTDVWFPILFKVGPFVADVAGAAILWRIWRARGASELATAGMVNAYLWSPVAILDGGVSRQYRQTCWHSCCCWPRFSPKGPAAILAGLALAAAINVKSQPRCSLPPASDALRSSGHHAFPGRLRLARSPFCPL